MKLRHRKLMVYIIQHATLTVFYMKETDQDVRMFIVKMIVAIGVIFVGGVVANSFIKSRWFQPGLNEVNNGNKENNQ